MQFIAILRQILLKGGVWHLTRDSDPSKAFYGMDVSSNMSSFAICLIILSNYNVTVSIHASQENCYFSHLFLKVMNIYIHFNLGTVL